KPLTLRSIRTVTIAVMSSPYDTIAELYDPWSASVVEDVAFYLEEARRSGGPVIELGVGTGRIAVPIAADGIRIIGVDSSRGMLRTSSKPSGAGSSASPGSSSTQCGTRTHGR